MKARNDEVLVLQFARIWAVIMMMIVCAAEDALFTGRTCAVDHRMSFLAALATGHPVLRVVFAPLLVAGSVAVQEGQAQALKIVFGDVLEIARIYDKKREESSNMYRKE